MTDQQRKQAREDINRRPLTDFVTLEASRGGMYCCPICGSGHHSNSTGALKLYTLQDGGYRAMCYSGRCFGEKGEDTLGALRRIWSCDEAEVLIRTGYEMGAAWTPPQQRQPQPQPQEVTPPRTPPRVDADYSEFYRECHNHLLQDSAALEYLHRRGIKDESIERFNLGSCSEWTHPQSPKSQASHRIIVPRSSRTYLARAIAADAYKPKQVVGTQRDPFGIDTLTADEGLYAPIIVEGELDAITLLQAGFDTVIGLGGVSSAGAIEAIQRIAPQKVFVLALDNDEDKSKGAAAQARLADAFSAAGLLCVSADSAEVYGTAKDANEAAQADEMGLCERLDNYSIQAQQLQHESATERAQKNGAAAVEDFLTVIRTRRFEPLPTGIDALDGALNGGLIRQQIIILQAAPATGKTALASQIAESMAVKGKGNTIFLNLEMSREQLIARSVSRLAKTAYKKELTALDILQGYRWTAEQERAVQQSAEIYKECIAPRVTYNPDGMSQDVDALLRSVELEACRQEAAGNAAPMVVLDYLQLITGKQGEDTRSTVIRCLTGLKRYAMSHNALVMVLSATNRDANRSGTVGMESGRDTSGIEYGADLLLGLSFRAVEDGEISMKDLSDKLRRGKASRKEQQRMLKILKSRFSEPYRSVIFDFDGAHSLFTSTTY